MEKSVWFNLVIRKIRIRIKRTTTLINRLINAICHHRRLQMLLELHFNCQHRIELIRIRCAWIDCHSGFYFSPIHLWLCEILRFWIANQLVTQGIRNKCKWLNTVCTLSPPFYCSLRFTEMKAKKSVLFYSNAKSHTQFGKLSCNLPKNV